MRFVVPVLSVIVLACAVGWSWFNGQLHTTSQVAYLSGVAESAPYLMLGILLLQSAVVYAMLKVGNRTEVVAELPVPDEEPVFESSVSSPLELVNTEWVLDALAGGVIVTDSRGHITYVNASAEKLTLDLLRKSPEPPNWRHEIH